MQHIGLYTAGGRRPQMYVSNLNFCKCWPTCLRLELTITGFGSSFVPFSFWANRYKYCSPDAMGQVSCRPTCMSVTLMYCGQTVGRIKTPLDTEVGLGPIDIVLGGNPAPLRKGAQQPRHFSAHVCCGQTVAHINNCYDLLLQIRFGIRPRPIQVILPVKL